MNLYKKALLVTIMASASSSLYASDGTINFTGEVLETACSINFGADNKLNVILGKISKTSFSSAGETSAATKFTIKLKNCPESLKSATVKFDGKLDSGNNNFLALSSGASGEAVAEGIAVALYDSSQNLLPMMTSSENYALKADTENNLDFYARYISTTGSEGIKAGSANATSTFNIIYN